MTPPVAAKPDLYFSVDVETDGPVPGMFSMASIGVSCAASFDGERFERRDPRADTFYAELAPISETFNAEALAISGLTREHLLARGAAPTVVMPRLNDWIREVADGFTPVFVAYPLPFDWLWTYFYFVTFGPRPGDSANCPFGHADAIDAKTLYLTKSGRPVGWPTRRSIPQRLLPAAAHTHNALDDAVEQAELFCNLREWDGRP